MQERRKEPRKNLMAYTQVFDLYGGYQIGTLGDLTLKGAMVISEHTLEKNAELTLAIELPDLPDIQVTRITIPARVVWSQQDISPEYFNIGFEFNNPKPDQLKAIQAIIDNYEFRRDSPNYPIKPSPSK
ncbi:MAG: PilZ domain-containing protein [Chloroflexi bacterium]|nr:PilZ domain-containing protein [Chloroflexota bacterium]